MSKSELKLLAARKSMKHLARVSDYSIIGKRGRLNSQKKNDEELKYEE